MRWKVQILAHTAADQTLKSNCLIISFSRGERLRQRLVYYFMAVIDALQNFRQILLDGYHNDVIQKLFSIRLRDHFRDLKELRVHFQDNLREALPAEASSATSSACREWLRCSGRWASAALESAPNSSNLCRTSPRPWCSARRRRSISETNGNLRNLKSGGNVRRYRRRRTRPRSKSRACARCPYKACRTAPTSKEFNFRRVQGRFRGVTL